MPPKYKPGGKRFPPRVTSKCPPSRVINENSEGPAAISLDQDAQNQFELELRWCIQQLQIAVQTGKLSEKRSLEATKTLNLLSGDVASIRKRQAMRNTFGDYRAKMIQDEKKYGKYISNVKFSTPTMDHDKFVFLRKVTNADKGTNEKDASCAEAMEGKDNKKIFVMSKEPSDAPFKFNFTRPESK